ncbi:hypothetical protein B1748_01250 [Paenibacillus sp. MY03]|jgi:hypothetical protein|uniref:Uncharacterized protein n=1 Tax=Paenibacillus agaridevorans TaxID=171404 RepID=A0A2R5F0Y9_9BACL|nr:MULTISPECIES: hypothetical protein [Paenibacillus]OUS78730.1 hypothetical protein B1748_01250 [Paenibacillus sp. MY03]GBG09813.1 hypothetical protein PAT3040_04483 [Paenibacillus agaridevorans]
MKITSGGFEVVYHGRVFAYEMNPIEIVLSEENDPLAFVFCIEYIQEQDDFTTDIRLVKYNEVRITCVNFPRGKPIGSSDMIHLGILNNRKLSLRYEITVNSDASSWALTFTFYAGEGVPAHE